MFEGLTAGEARIENVFILPHELPLAKVTQSAIISEVWVTIRRLKVGNLRKTKTGSDVAIIGGVLFFEDARQCEVDAPEFEQIIGDGYTNAIRVISLSSRWIETEWIDWDSKIKTEINVEMTMRREVRSGRGYWYAYRRVFGKLHKKYMGQDDQITQSLILKVAQKMPSI